MEEPWKNNGRRSNEKRRSAKKYLPSLAYRQFCAAHMKQKILILRVGVPKGSFVYRKNT